MSRRSGAFASAPRASALPVDGGAPILATVAKSWSYSTTPIAAKVREMRETANRITCEEVARDRTRLLEILYCVDKAGESGESTLRESIRVNAAEAVELAVRIKRATMAYQVLEGAPLVTVARHVMEGAMAGDRPKKAARPPVVDISALDAEAEVEVFTQGAMAL